MDVKLEKLLQQINSECQLENAMSKADLDMKISEKLKGKSQEFIDAYFSGWGDALTEREEILQTIREKHEALYRTHPEFFLAENATVREREEYARLHNI